MFTFVFYSHHEYSDIWPVLFGQCEKYIKEHKKVLFTNEGTAPEGWEVITYDDSLPYQQRVVSCLEQLDDDIIIFHHEDMILYSGFDRTSLKRYIELVEKDEVTFIKLLRGGYSDEKIKSDADHSLLCCSPNMVFTIQPTICKVSNLLTMYKETPGDSIWSFESNTHGTSIRNKFSGCMSFREGDEKRGMYHWDSSIYPYVATAVVKGKWYTSEYPELVKILEKYKVNVDERGTV